MMLRILIALLFFVVCSDALVHALVLVLAVVATVPLYIGLQLVTRFHFSDFNFNFIK
jgi:membrane-anchored protein YejM (alkaline phosphatase superfamily)